MSPWALLLLCCALQAALLLWLYPVIDCVCSWMSHTRTEPLITPGAMDDPRTEMQSDHTLCDLSAGCLGEPDDERRWAELRFTAGAPHACYLPSHHHSCGEIFLQVRASGKTFTTREKRDSWKMRRSMQHHRLTLLWLYFQWELDLNHCMHQVFVLSALMQGHIDNSAPAPTR